MGWGVFDGRHGKGREACEKEREGRGIAAHRSRDFWIHVLIDFWSSGRSIYEITIYKIYIETTKANSCKSMGHKSLDKGG